MPRLARFALERRQGERFERAGSGRGAERFGAVELLASAREAAGDGR